MRHILLHFLADLRHRVGVVAFVLQALFHLGHIVHFVHLYIDLLIGNFFFAGALGKAVGCGGQLAGILQPHYKAAHRHVVLAVIAHQRAHYHQLVGFLHIALIVLQLQGHAGVLRVHKGGQRIAVFIGLAGIAIAGVAVGAALGILKVIAELLAHQHRDLVFAKAAHIGKPCAALQRKAHGLHAGFVQTVNIIRIGFIAAVCARFDAAVQVFRLVIGGHRRNMGRAANALYQSIVQRIFAAAGIVIHLDHGQIAPRLQHFFVLGIHGNAKADHNHDGAGAHHNADYRERCTPLAPSEIIQRKAEQIRNPHRFPPAI